MFAKVKEQHIYDFFLEHGPYLLQQHALTVVNVLKWLCSVENTQHMLQPERFINFLLFDEKSCLEFLEHVTKIELHNNNSTLNNILLELYLRAWQQSTTNISTNELLEFLEARKEQFCAQHAFILCRLYSFWPGLKYLYNNCLQHDKNMQNNEVANEFKSYTQTLMKTLNRKESGEACEKSHLFENLLNDLIYGKEQTILQILQSLCNNKAIQVSHVREYFMQQHFKRNDNAMQEAKKIVEDLLQTKQKLKDLLEQYNKNPIEFRSSICDICKHELKPPAKYFLCQHSYHKECLSAYAESEVCVACLGKKKAENILSDVMNVNSDEITAYTDVFCHGIFNQARKELATQKETALVTNKYIPQAPFQFHLGDGNQHWPGRFHINQIKPKSTNPFEDDKQTVSESARAAAVTATVNTVQPSKNPFEEYDNNLNPFNE